MTAGATSAEHVRAVAVAVRAAHRQDGVLTAADAAAAGMMGPGLRRVLRRGEWAPLLRGTYLVEVDRSGMLLERSWARAAVLGVPVAVVGMGTAARLHGLQGVRPPGAVQVLVPPGAERRPRPGLDPHVTTLAPSDVVALAGLPVTSGVRTLADLVPRLSRLDALAALDSALRTGLVDAAGLRAAQAMVVGRRGSLAVADLWDLADGRAESPLESRVRLRCLDSGLVPDELQVPLRDEHGHVLARGDLGFRRRSRPSRGWLVVEADGQDVHSTPEALYRDRWRADTLVAPGHDVVRCTWVDTLRPVPVPAMVRAAL